MAVELFELAPAQEIQVFYIIQEALANIRKHSAARNVRILLNNQDELYTVLIVPWPEITSTGS